VDICGNIWEEFIQELVLSFSHSSNSFQIEYLFDLDGGNTDESGGIT
jgi:hypothetical protein